MAARLEDWIGRTETAHDLVTEGLIERYVATLGRALAGREPPATLGLHWCLAPPAVPLSDTGPDGHPARGGFLPPVPLPRRMWAGGALIVHDMLQAGDLVERHSRIADVRMKEGRSGRLCFVTVEHRHVGPRGLVIEERQDIVYREAPAGPQPLSGAPASPDRPGDIAVEIEATPPLLFRYSALTFNGHRIHYDRVYAIEVEHYPGLVVHGPLQATLALRLAAAAGSGQRLRRFTYRGVSPLIAGETFRVRARRETDDTMVLSVVAADGRETMTGQAEW
ncbi:MAG: MaoC family dehydratase N-terminal domain-containing protein [Hyphomicrobiaceae bacterium]